MGSFENKDLLPKLQVSSYIIIRVFIRHRRSENSPSTTQNSPAKFCSLPERTLLFHDNSPTTLHRSPATTILNENPDYVHLKDSKMHL